MQRKEDVRRLREVVRVRGAQQQAAEVELSRAAAALREAERRRDEGRRELDDFQAAWMRHQQAERMPLELSLAWSAAVVESERRLTDLEAARREMETERARKAEAWRLAQAHLEAAETVTAQAARRVRRRLEEAVLDAAADRAAQKAVRA